MCVELGETIKKELETASNSMSLNVGEVLRTRVSPEGNSLYFSINTCTAHINLHTHSHLYMQL